MTSLFGSTGIYVQYILMSYKLDNEEYSLYGYLLTVINIGQLNKYVCMGSFDHRYLAKKTVNLWDWQVLMVSRCIKGFHNKKVTEILMAYLHSKFFNGDYPLVN